MSSTLDSGGNAEFTRYSGLRLHRLVSSLLLSKVLAILLKSSGIVHVICLDLVAGQNCTNVL